jgi:hypothetical protein
VCLVASPDAVSERLERREPDRWPGKRPLIAHAREPRPAPATQRQRAKVSSLDKRKKTTTKSRT